MLVTTLAIIFASITFIALGIIGILCWDTKRDINALRAAIVSQDSPTRADAKNSANAQRAPFAHNELSAKGPDGPEPTALTGDVGEISLDSSRTAEEQITELASKAGIAPAAVMRRFIYEECLNIGASHNLTTREVDVIARLMRGKSYEGIGRDLCISGHTVKTHVSKIYAKLNVHSRDELIDYLESVIDERAAA